MGATTASKDPQFKMLPINSLEITWEGAQRPLDQNHVDRIAKSMDPSAYGVIETTRVDGNGHYHIIDGQHRVAAMKQLGWTVKVPCLIHDIDGDADAARRFLISNTTKKIQAIDRFRVAVTAGERVENEIHDAVTRHGLKIGYNSEFGHIACVTALLAVYNAWGSPRTHKQLAGGQDAVDRTLALLISAFPGDRDAVHQALVKGVGGIVNAHGVDLDDDRLVNRLSKSTSAAALVGRGKTLKDTFKFTHADGVAWAVIDLYNHGRKQGRLPAWS